MANKDALCFKTKFKFAFKEVVVCQSHNIYQMRKYFPGISISKDYKTQTHGFKKKDAHKISFSLPCLIIIVYY